MTPSTAMSLRPPRRRPCASGRWRASRRCAGSTGCCCSRSPALIGARRRCSSGRRPGSGCSTPASTRRPSSSGTWSTPRSAARSAPSRRWSTTGRCARTRPSSTSLSCLGLVAVLSPLGSTINGAHSWIVLGGGFQVQPSEFAKVALVVGMAMLLAEKRDGEEAPRDGDVLLVLALAAVPIALIMLQPDLGTVLVLVFIVLGVLAHLRRAGALDRRAGARRGRRRAPGRCSSGCSTTTRWTASRRSPTPTLDPRGVGYNTNQARIAIGSGGRLRQGAVRGHADQRPLHPRAADRLRLHGRGGGARAGRRRRAARCCSGVVLWRGLRIAARRQGPLRPAGRGRRRLAGSPSRASSTSG